MRLLVILSYFIFYPINNEPHAEFSLPRILLNVGVKFPVIIFPRSGATRIAGGINGGGHKVSQWLVGDQEAQATAGLIGLVITSKADHIYLKYI